MQARPSITTRNVADQLDDYRWLVSDDAAELLAAAATWLEPSAAQVAALRRQTTAQRAHLVLEQVALRDKGRAKFAAAAEMLFARRALEQATDEIVATYKAARFSGRGAILDLCSGIGGDSLALARQGDVTAVDRDPILAIIGQANLDRQARTGSSVGGARVVVGDVRDADVARAGAWHIDPDRRPSGRRTTRVELHEPGVEVLEALLARNADAAIKLAPAAEMPPTWTECAELEWISRDGECRQLVAWFGALANRAGERRATILGASSAPLGVVTGAASHDPPVGPIGRFLYEPDAAVLAAGLCGSLAAAHDLAAIAPAIAYLTSDRRFVHPALDGFEVSEVLPLDVKQLKSLLRLRGIGRLEIKKRGIDVDPAKLRQRLDLAGDHEATLIVARVGGRATAILAQRMR